MTLKEYIKEKNISQKAIAIECKVTESAVSRWVSGKKRVNKSHKIALARVLGVDVLTLIKMLEETEIKMLEEIKDLYDFDIYL